MRLRHLPRVPACLREERRQPPDTLHIRAVDTNVGPRYIVEARRGGRCLGDKAFASYGDALAFAKLECGWHGAKLQDEVKRG